MPAFDQTNWSEISNEEAFRLSQAEFRGMVIQALKDIRSDVNDMKQQNAITRYISIAIAGIAGIISGILGRDFTLKNL